MGNCCGLFQSDKQAVPGGKPLLRNKTQRLKNWQTTGVVALRDANLKEVPQQALEVGAAARTLDATNNRLSALPEGFAGALPNLQRLVLASNALTALPPSIGQLRSLKVRVLRPGVLAPPACAAGAALVGVGVG